MAESEGTSRFERGFTPDSVPRTLKPKKPPRRPMGVAGAALDELLQALQAIRALPRRPLLGKSKAKPRKPSPLYVLPEPVAPIVGTFADAGAAAAPIAGV